MAVLFAVMTVLTIPAFVFYTSGSAYSAVDQQALMQGNKLVGA